MNAKSLGDQPASPLDQKLICPPCIGMTKRELFAAMALQGLIANSTRSGTIEMAADYALQLADALLAELAENQS